MSDNFEEIFDDPKPEEAQPEVETPEVEVKAEEPEATPEAEAPKEAAAKPEAPMVPLSVLMDERDKRQKLEAAMMGQPKEPETVPDVLDDQDAFTNHLTRQFEQKQLVEKMRTSRFYAEREFGKEAVQEAYDYFNENPAQSQALLSEVSPFHAAVETFKAQQLKAEIGTDPKAYEDRVRAKVLAEIQAEAATKAIMTAPSQANETSIGARQVPAGANFTALDDLLPD